jgi:hypothetical protein
MKYLRTTAVTIGILLPGTFISYPFLQRHWIIPIRARNRCEEGKRLIQVIHDYDRSNGEVPGESSWKIRGNLWYYRPLEQHAFTIHTGVGIRTSLIYRETQNPDRNGWFLSLDGDEKPYLGN